MVKKKAIWLLIIRQDFSFTALVHPAMRMKIKQPSPDAALDLSYAISVTGGLYNCKECFFLKFNNCFHDTDVYWTVFIFITLWNGYPVLYIGSF